MKFYQADSGIRSQVVQTFGNCRKCKICGHSISMYRPGDRCAIHVHTTKLDKEREKDTKLRLLYEKRRDEARARLLEKRRIRKYNKGGETVAKPCKKPAAKKPVKK